MMKKLLIIFVVLCIAAPAMAAEWNFYGSARFATFWTDFDADTNDETEDDEGLQWDQQGNSRIGANVEFNDAIGGGFEYGHDTSENNIDLRKMFGTYTFGAGQLLIGQTYTPTALLYSNSVWDDDGDLLGVGEFYESRLPMIQLKFGGFKIALIKPNTEDVEEIAATDATADLVTGIVTPGEDAKNFDTDSTIPKIEVSYRFKADAFFVDVFGGYQTYKLDGLTQDFDVDSYVFGGGGGVNLGPVYIKANGHIGQNLGNYGAYQPGTDGLNRFIEDGLDDEIVIDKVNNTELDTDGYGFIGVVGVNIGERVTIEGGYGYENSEKDTTGAQDEEAYQWYVNATINIAPGFFIVPELGQIAGDFDTAAGNPDPNPTETYFGAKWQINF